MPKIRKDPKPNSMISKIIKSSSFLFKTYQPENSSLPKTVNVVLDTEGKKTVVTKVKDPKYLQMMKTELFLGFDVKATQETMVYQSELTDMTCAQLPTNNLIRDFDELKSNRYMIKVLLDYLLNKNVAECNFEQIVQVLFMSYLYGVEKNFKKLYSQKLTQNYKFSELDFFLQAKLIYVFAKDGIFKMTEINTFLDSLNEDIQTGQLIPKLTNESKMSDFIYFLNGFLLLHLNPEQLARLDLPRLFYELQNTVLAQSFKYKENILGTLSLISREHVSFLIRKFAGDIYLHM